MALRLILLGGALMLAAAPALAEPARAPAAQPGIADGRSEFRAVFCELMQRDHPGEGCNDWLRRFPDEAPAASPPVSSLAHAVNIVIVGGLFSECLPDGFTFGDAAPRLRAGGYRVSYAPVKGRAGADANAAIIRAHVARERAAQPGLPLMIVAYSKGVADTMTALAAYPELADSVGAVISVAGVVNGSHTADKSQRLYNATAGLLPYSRCPASDGGELRTLTHDYRRNWLATHRLPAAPLYFSIVGLPSPQRISAVFSVFRRGLARIDARNDGQMIYADAMLPRSELLGYANADHFAIALPIAGARLLGVNRNDFPRPQLIEAAVRIAEARLLARTGR